MVGHTYPERRDIAEGPLRQALRVTRDARGMNVLVYDDVFTDGLTLNEVAGALRRAEANAVCGVTLCRQPYRGPALASCGETSTSMTLRRPTQGELRFVPRPVVIVSVASPLSPEATRQRRARGTDARHFPMPENGHSQGQAPGSIPENLASPVARAAESAAENYGAARQVRRPARRRRAAHGPSDLASGRSGWRLSPQGRPGGPPQMAPG